MVFQEGTATPLVHGLIELVRRFSNIILKEMKEYSLWIKADSFYHLRVWKLKKLWECPHLQNLDPPRQDLEPPSITSLKTHEATFEVAKKNPEIEPKAFRRARDKYVEALQLHGHNRQAATVKATQGPGQRPTSGGGDAPLPSSGSSRPERVESSSCDSSSRTEEEDDQDQTIPMEVYPSWQGGGDSCSWSEWVDDEEAWGQQSWHFSNKRTQGASDYWSNPQTAIPFPFNDEAREIACEKLFN